MAEKIASVHPRSDMISTTDLPLRPSFRTISGSAASGVKIATHFAEPKCMERWESGVLLAMTTATLRFN